jgi:hypothetical protein
MAATPAARAGIASALINASREVAGLLGITIIGAVLRVRQGAALHQGTSPSGSFLDGYHAGLVLTIGLVVVGAVVSYLALRRAPDMTGTATEGAGELAPAQEALAPVPASTELAPAERAG